MFEVGDGSEKEEQVLLVMRIGGTLTPCFPHIFGHTAVIGGCREGVNLPMACRVNPQVKVREETARAL